VAHSLDSTRLKLARAREHFKQLDTERRAFLDTQPFLYVPHYDNETGRHEIRVRKLADPPLRLGLLAGDVIHNYRAALDHLVYQVAGHGPRGESGRGDRTQFPIFDRKRDFDSHIATYLKGVPKEAVPVFELFQPYMGGERLIAMVAALDDRDKHRVLTPVAAAPFAGRLRLIESNATRVETLKGPIYLDDGAVVCVFWTAPKVHVVAHFELDTTLVFGDQTGETLSLTDLANFGNLVDTILLNFTDMIDLVNAGLPLDGSARLP
jgi:hypothetical protein